METGYFAACSRSLKLLVVALVVEAEAAMVEVKSSGYPVSKWMCTGVFFC